MEPLCDPLLIERSIGHEGSMSVCSFDAGCAEFAAASANQTANAMSEADVTSSMTCNVDSEAMPPSVTRRGP